MSNLCNTVVWIVSTHPLISTSFSLGINILMTVPRAVNTFGKTVTDMFHSSFNSQARLRYLFFFSFSFNLTTAETAKSKIQQVLFFVDYDKAWSSDLG